MAENSFIHSVFGSEIPATDGESILCHICSSSKNKLM